MDVILEFIGGIVTLGGGSVAIAYAAFKQFGKSWIEHHFSKELENFKAEKQKDLEQVRYQITHEFSRVSKIHAKEFDVLPKAWELALIAYGKVHDITRALKQYPDLNNMNAKELAEFLTKSTLSESSKEQLLDASDKNRIYQDKIIWIELAEAKKAQIELNNFLYLNSIFMTEKLENLFQEMNKTLQRILIENEIGTRNKVSEMVVSSIKTTGEIGEKFDDLKAAVKERLKYEMA